MFEREINNVKERSKLNYGIKGTTSATPGRCSVIYIRH